MLIVKDKKEKLELMEIRKKLNVIFCLIVVEENYLVKNLMNMENVSMKMLYFPALFLQV